MSNPQQIAALAAQAGRAANVGAWADAERLWTEVRRLDPAHPEALYSLSMHAFQRGDLAGAAELAALARGADPASPMLALSAAVIAQHAGRADTEIEAIEAALALDPYFLPALLAKAGFQERQGLRTLAAATYRNCLRIAPPPQATPAHLRPQLDHARRMADEDTRLTEAHLLAAIGEAGGRLSGPVAQRWREAVAIMAGRTRPYHADCNQLHVPRLPAIPFFERTDFAWVPELEARTDAIRAELAAALAAQEAEFRPYIGYNPGEPVNQWAELNHSRRWSTYALWQGGHRVEPHLAACPQTAAALEAVEMADIDGLCPNAMFSALAPHTEIPPHHGETNARLVVHLPLIVPDRCTYRVGFEERTWQPGQTLIFDDTLEHTARNDSDELRVVLIFDVWNPLLSADEREMVRVLTRAKRVLAGQ